MEYEHVIESNVLNDARTNEFLCTFQTAIAVWFNLQCNGEKWSSSQSNNTISKRSKNKFQPNAFAWFIPIRQRTWVWNMEKSIDTFARHTRHTQTRSQSVSKWLSIITEPLRNCFSLALAFWDALLSVYVVPVWSKRNRRQQSKNSVQQQK